MYHSTLLHVIVLHRIVARDGDHYIFKGDNNNFLDPLPARPELIGGLWLHVRHGGRVDRGAARSGCRRRLCALLGLSLFVGAERTRGRRSRARRLATGSGGQGAPSMKLQTLSSPVQFGPLLPPLPQRPRHSACSLSLPSPVRSRGRPRAPRRSPNELRLQRACATDPSIRHGFINTGDPIFLSIVHRQPAHRLSAHEQRVLTVAGAEDVVLKLLGPGGWSRNFVLVPATHFTGHPPAPM